MDAHASHYTTAFLEAATAIGFDIVVLPGGTSFALQPWNQCFAAVKKAWVKQRDAYFADNPVGGALTWPVRVGC